MPEFEVQLVLRTRLHGFDGWLEFKRTTYLSFVPFPGLRLDLDDSAIGPRPTISGVEFRACHPGHGVFAADAFEDIGTVQLDAYRTAARKAGWTETPTSLKIP